MSGIKIISRQDIQKVLTLPMAIEAVENAYLQKYTGGGQVWPMVFHEFDPGRADMDIKSGNLNQQGIFGLKLVSWFGSNPSRDLPALYGTSMIFDIATGMPLAVLNASAMTALRTGAAGAVGAKYLARKDSENLLVVGCGFMAPYLAAATLLTMPTLKKVVFVNPSSPDHAALRLDALTDQVDALLRQAGTVRSAEIFADADVKRAVSDSDIILTATPSHEPMIDVQWVRPGTHFSCIGADLSGKQEIDSAILAKAKVYGDDTHQCLNVGECEIPYKQGVIGGLNAEIGAVIAGEASSRTGDDDVTVFDSTGIALQDLACAAMILNACNERGLGTIAEL